MQCPDCGAKQEGEGNYPSRCPECHDKMVAALNARLEAAAAESTPLIEANNQAEPTEPRFSAWNGLRLKTGGQLVETTGCGGGRHVIHSGKRFS